MTNQKTKIFIVKHIQRLNNSYYGNPRYEIVLMDNKYNYYIAKTGSDISSAYGVGNYMLNNQYEITYHFTTKGNMIIDYIYFKGDKNND